MRRSFCGVVAAAGLLLACADADQSDLSMATSTTTAIADGDRRPPTGDLFPFAMAFDVEAGIVVATAGRETWSLDVTIDRWSKRNAPVPDVDPWLRLVYSPDAGAVLLITRRGQVFTYDNAADTWTERPAAGTLPLGQPPFPFLVGLDGQTGKVIALVGSSHTVWSYGVADGTWSEVDMADAPTAPWDAGALMTYDSVAGGFVVLAYFEGTQLGDPAWLVDVAHRRWIELPPGPTPFEINFGYFPQGTEATYATSVGKSVMFSDGVTAEYSGSEGQWAVFPVAAPNGDLGVGPLYRMGATLMYDPTKDRVLMYGGQSRTAVGWEYRNDMWAYDTVSHTWSIVLE